MRTGDVSYPESYYTVSRKGTALEEDFIFLQLLDLRRLN